MDTGRTSEPIDETSGQTGSTFVATVPTCIGTGATSAAISDMAVERISGGISRTSAATIGTCGTIEEIFGAIAAICPWIVTDIERYPAQPCPRRALAQSGRELPRFRGG